MGVLLQQLVHIFHEELLCFQGVYLWLNNQPLAGRWGKLLSRHIAAVY